MFYIVESENQLQYLVNSRYEECYVEVIPTGYESHPCVTTPCLLYVREVNHHKGFIIPINHTEGINIPYDRVLEIIGNIDTILTLDKKFLLYYIKHKNIIDVSLLYSLNEYKSLENAEDSKYAQILVHKHPQVNDLNRIIPLPLHYDKCEKNFSKAKKVIDRYRAFLKDPSWEFYNNDTTGVYYCIEKNGMHVDPQEFLDAFKPHVPARSMLGDQVYTCYNLTNTTGRPSNSFNGVNFLAIPKTEVRKAIKPGNDVFMEVDFDGYHIRLLGELTGYQLTEEPIHIQLGKLYFKKDELTQEEYEKSKQITFQNLYSDHIQDMLHIPFFKKVHQYAEEIWETYSRDKQIRVPGSNKLYTNKLNSMNKQKLLNYFLQNYETTRNVKVFKELLKYLGKYSTKVILCTYDAILFDLCEEERDEILQEVLRILTTDNKYPVKIKYGKSYFL